MFPGPAAAIFLVNRPCAARHRPAKTVIAGLDPAIHRELGAILARQTRPAPLPLVGGGSCWFARCVRQHLPPPQPLPSRLRACPLPASNESDQPRQAGVGWGGERTECAGGALLTSAPDSHFPRHPCEMTGNLGILFGTLPSRPGLRRIDDTQKPSPLRGKKTGHDLELLAPAG